MQRGTYFGIILLSALALIAAAGAQAADPTVLWNRTYGETYANDSAYAIVSEPGGAGFFLAGETASSGEGKTDAWVIRLTSEGTEEWNRTYGGGEADTARSIIQTDDGNLLFAGNLTLVTNETQADTDAWIMKIDPSGSEVWNRTYGGPDVNASAHAVTGTDDGGYLFVGSITPRGGNESAAWAVRLNESGAEVWNRTFGGVNNTADAVARLPGGDFAVAGSTGSSGAGMADVWVVRLNESGTEIWNRTFGSPDDDAGRAVINTSDGGLLVAGTFTERPDNTTVDTDALLIKLTPDGNITWNWIYGDFGVNESAAAVIETADGGYLFAGETGYPGEDDTDAWLIATDAGGAVAWSRTFGGENPDDKAASIVEIAPGEHVFAGTFNATERGGPVNTDAWAVRLGPRPEPTPTPTATPTPAPTAAPAKPSKAPIVSREPPAPAPTMTTPVPGAPPESTASPAPTAVPTGFPTSGPTWTTVPTGAPTVTATAMPSPTGTQDNDDDDNDDDDDNGDDNSDSLSGMVWYDLNANGILDPGEPGIPGISVRLIGERTMMDYTITGPDGSYRFGDVAPGRYAGTEFVLPDGFSCTISGLDNHAAPLDGNVAYAEVVDGRRILNAGLTGSPFPLTPAAAYGWVLGTTWSDGNQDGIWDETDGLTDVEVTLLDAGGNVAASARTGYHDSYFSMYLFGPLPPGEYSLAFTPPDDYIFTSIGGDSHADPSTGTTAPFTVGGGDMVVRDAGLILSLAPTPTVTPPEEPTPTVTPPEEPTPTVTPGPENGTAGDGENTRDAPAATPDGDLPSAG
ncbi:SdrD B-like domain-containing protein [Methanoculleus sp.]|uniref:SdrD B-like domain-containing protein n=1 Tax=Methanoculleus sp. TaxID=90427 RepID=UPI0025DCB288|nr:SdrD B-like domain-containing protein [Methanoculleus sp.]